jgi:hypothetical protein
MYISGPLQCMVSSMIKQSNNEGFRPFMWRSEQTVKNKLREVYKVQVKFINNRY